MHYKFFLFLALGSSILGQQVYALNPFNPLCWGNSWSVTECQVTTTYQDGEIVKSGFIPEKEQNVSTKSCYGVGCHPMYCSDWRNDIRTSCKNEYMRQRKQLSKFAGQQKPIESLSFEGCAIAPSISGILYPAEWISRKALPESWYSVCTLDTDEQQNVFLTWAKKNGATILEWFKQNASSGWQKAKELFTSPELTPEQQAERLILAQRMHSTGTSSIPLGMYTKAIVREEKTEQTRSSNA